MAHIQYLLRLDVLFYINWVHSFSQILTKYSQQEFRARQFLLIVSKEEMSTNNITTWSVIEVKDTRADYFPQKSERIAQPKTTPSIPLCDQKFI